MNFKTNEQNECRNKFWEHLESSLNMAFLSGSEATPYSQPSPISVVTTGSAEGLHAQRR